MDRPMRVLYITSLSIVPAYSGGPVRTYNIAKELAKKVDLTLILPQTEASVRADAVWGPALSTVRILGPDCAGADRRSPVRRTLDAWLERRRRHFWRKNPLRTTFMPWQPWYGLIDRTCSDHRPDVIILEQSWHIETLLYVRRHYPTIPCILSAQNVKSTVFHQLLTSLTPHSADAKAIRRYEQWCRGMETSLYRFVDAVWACSPSDLQVFAQRTAAHPLPLSVMANGVDPFYFAVDRRPEKARIPRIIYGGSLCWEPSAEAVRFFYKRIWPLITQKRPDLQWVILGRDPPQWMKDMVAHDPSIIFLGEVPDARPHFANASVSICPLLSGSGTRLKILEAMSMGNPVVSTTIGAEGIAVTNGQELLIADTPEDFAAAVLRLVSDATLFDSLRHRGRACVEKKYEWSHLMQPAFRSLEVMTGRKISSTES